MSHLIENCKNLILQNNILAEIQAVYVKTVYKFSYIILLHIFHNILVVCIVETSYFGLLKILF